MLMSKAIMLLLTIMLISCSNKNSKKTLVHSTKKDSTVVVKEDIKKLKYTEYVLDRTSKNKISGWIKYSELETIVKEVQNADLSYFKTDKKVVETLIDEFAETIPELINTDAVNARILIVKNMYLKLNGIINLSTSNKEDIQKGIIDFLEAFSNLNFQINKKFERDSQNIVKP